MYTVCDVCNVCNVRVKELLFTAAIKSEEERDLFHGLQL